MLYPRYRKLDGVNAPYPHDTWRRWVHGAWDRLPGATWRALRAQAAREFSPYGGRIEHQLTAAGYWTRRQLAAVPDDWLQATVRYLGAAGLRKIRTLAPYRVEDG